MSLSDAAMPAPAGSCNASASEVGGGKVGGCAVEALVDMYAHGQQPGMD
jgi:hypothetical protein